MCISQQILFLFKKAELREIKHMESDWAWFHNCVFVGVNLFVNGPPLKCNTIISARAFFIRERDWIELSRIESVSRMGQQCKKIQYDATRNNELLDTLRQSTMVDIAQQPFLNQTLWYCCCMNRDERSPAKEPSLEATKIVRTISETTRLFRHSRNRRDIGHSDMLGCSATSVLCRDTDARSF